MTIWSGTWRRSLGAASIMAAALLVGMPAGATNIERVVSPGGIEAWMVRDTTVPLIAVDFAFAGGSAQDPADKPGVGNFMADMLDEGAGDLKSEEFKDRLERKAIEMTFRADRDFVHGTMRTLKDNRDEAFGLLQLALTSPRFDAPALERVRGEEISLLQRNSTSPNDIASRRWWATAFPNHPYGHTTRGTLESVPTITADDLRAYSKRILARDHLKIAVVGDVDAETVGRLLDRTFGQLPVQAELAPVPDVAMQGVGSRITVSLNVPQTVIQFGAPGLRRSDPDFMAAYIVNHILGGGSFSSRLFREVREKRGLAYGISDNLLWLQHSAVLIGGTATRSNATAQTLEVMEQVVKNMAAQGPTEEELEKAKTFLKGSYALSLDTSTKIAGQLVQMQVDNLGIDYIERRSALIDAVTLDEAKRVAKRLLSSGLLVTVVGRAQDIGAKGPGG